MKVLFFTRKYPPSVGGMQKQSYHLTKEIECDKKIISYSGSQFWLPLVMIKFMFQGLVFANKFDVVHLSDAVLCKVGWFIKLIYKKSVIINIHGLDITFKNWFYQKYLDIFGKKFNLYICNSKNTELLAKEKGFKNTIVIPNGISLVNIEENLSFKDKKLDRFYHKNNKFYLTKVGILVKRKGVSWFIENVFLVLPKNVHYLIIGEGKEKKYLQSVINNKDFNKRVHLIGNVCDNDLEVIYQLTDIFIMPNIKVPNDVEGFGIVAIEASVRGIPVIASNIEGINDAIKDNKNGFLFPCKDKDALVNRIHRLINNSEYKKEFGAKSREYTQINYNWNKITRLYLDAFQDVLKHNE